MVIKINGRAIEPAMAKTDFDELIENQKKLRRITITWWIMAGSMLLSVKPAHAADTTTEDQVMSDTSNQLMWSFQDIVLTFGGVAFIVGLILFAVKRKWGVKTLQVTSFVAIGSFLVPSALLLLAIIGMAINDHLQTTLDVMRHQQNSH